MHSNEEAVLNQIAYSSAYNASERIHAARELDKLYERRAKREARRALLANFRVVTGGAR